MPRSKAAMPASTPRRVQVGRESSIQVAGVVLLSATAVLVGILLYLWPQMRLVDLGYRQGELRAQRVRGLQAQKELQVELATLRRLSRIEEIAVRRLGMRPPQLSQVIYIRSEPQTAAAARAQ
ncbi:MAG: cell division protein FtsL [Candidatus Tectomicrobia bacterium]